MKPVYASDETDTEVLVSLEKHLAMVEEQLESVIRKASSLPLSSKTNTGLSQLTFKKRLG